MVVIGFDLLLVYLGKYSPSDLEPPFRQYA